MQLGAAGRISAGRSSEAPNCGSWGVGGDQDPRISGAFAAEPPEVEGAGGALLQFPARTKSLKDPMGWPRNPVVASITVAEGRRHPRGATNLAGIYQRRGSESGTSNLP